MLPKVELGSTRMMVTKLGFGALELRDLEANGGCLPSEAHRERLLNVETLLRYAIAHPSAHTFIVGTRDPEHLRANVAAVEKGPLKPELHEAVRAAVEAVAG